MILKVCFIGFYKFFPCFGRKFVNTTSVEILTFGREPFIETFFHIFIWTKPWCSQVLITHKRPRYSCATKQSICAKAISCCGRYCIPYHYKMQKRHLLYKTFPCVFTLFQLPIVQLIWYRSYALFLSLNCCASCFCILESFLSNNAFNPKGSISLAVLQVPCLQDPSQHFWNAKTLVQFSSNENKN